MTICDKIKDNLEEELSALSDKELLQAILEMTHHKNAKTLAAEILSDNKKFADIFPLLETLFKQKLINEDAYILLKITQTYSIKKRR